MDMLIPWKFTSFAGKMGNTIPLVCILPIWGIEWLSRFVFLLQIFYL